MTAPARARRSGPVKVGIARVYDPPPSAPAHAVLVDRLWPRGLRKADAPFETWMRDVAPSTELRRWYGHEPERFTEFSARYRRELAEDPGRTALAELRRLARDGSLVLLTATKDLDLSGAAVLAAVLGGR